MILVKESITTMEKAEQENSHEPFSIVLGRLSDLGLGNPDGIKGIFANADNETIAADAEHDARELVEPTDLS